MTAAYLVVRAVVADPGDRPAFDAWYKNEHLPDALAAFGAETASRGWSELDPSVHCAFYRFPTLLAAQTASRGAEIQALIAEFDRVWDTRVIRSRDIISIAEELKGPSDV